MFKKRTLVILSFLSMCFLAFCFCTPSKVNDDAKMKTIIRNVKNTLTYMHYRPQIINDKFSEEVFNAYFESIDPSKRYFLQSDYDYFKKDYHNLDDYYNNQDMAFFNSTIDTLFQRYRDIKVFSEDILKEPFDYTIDEDFLIGSDVITYAKDKKQLKDYWRKYLKYNALNELIRLQGDSTKMNKPFAELEKEARENVEDNISDFFRVQLQLTKDKFLTKYINSFTERYDPHTNYFSPVDKDKFDVSISGQMEGIGALLQDKKGYPTIMELVVGSPAWKSGQIEVGDQIVKVKQKDGDAINIVGMVIDDVIRYIRGKKGTEVTLTLKKKDGELKDVKLIRDVIEWDEAFARSAIIEYNGEKYGIIYLPEFYTSINGNGGHDPSDDVVKEIEGLKKENIKGLIFDLRNNGGGSLDEAIQIAGLFIPKGPVVQVRRSDSQMKVYEDTDPTVQYDGPMVVLVNEASASASEIFAAAMQDYKRAIIVGSNKTFGKGTVQTFVPMNQSSFDSKDDLGSLKLTIQKFYRINGGSTQLKGVVPDIVLTDILTYSDVSESSSANALPWDQIKPVKYDMWNPAYNMTEIKRKSYERLKNSEYLNLMNQAAQYYKDLDKIDRVSLNLEKFKADRKMRESEAEKYDSISVYKTNMKVSSPQWELPKLKEDDGLKERRNSWHKSVSKDFYIKESVNILKDIS